MRVICISGKAQHGKDTTAAFMREALENKGNTVLTIHYADLLKYLCRTYFGWNGEKDEEGRRILQYVGTDVIRAKDPNYWVSFVAGFLWMFEDEWDYVIIPDTRFPNEVSYMQEAGYDVTHIRVTRPDFKSPLTEEQQQHPSETALDNIEPNLWIENSGTIQELHKKVDEVVLKDFASTNYDVPSSAPQYMGVRNRLGKRGKA